MYPLHRYSIALNKSLETDVEYCRLVPRLQLSHAAQSCVGQKEEWDFHEPCGHNQKRDGRRCQHHNRDDRHGVQNSRDQQPHGAIHH